MSAWTDLGLPRAQAGDYRYLIDAGLLRTPAETAQPRQVRRYTTNRRTFVIGVRVTGAQLRTALDYLDTAGYAGFALPLLSGETSGAPVSEVSVRLTQDPAVTAEGFDTYLVRLSVEATP